MSLELHKRTQESGWATSSSRRDRQPMTLSFIAQLDPTKILAAPGIVSILLYGIYRKSLVKQGKL